MRGEERACQKSNRLESRFYGRESFMESEVHGKKRRR